MIRLRSISRGWFWMFLSLGLLVAPGMAAAQAKRLGLVIGLADYGDVKHPTALQDAGLVAESLRQAGFDLTEAANLNQTEFRATFRDFLEKLQAAGPDPLVAVYLSGVGFQDDGENLLLPIDARLRQRADLSLEALRVSDLLRSLGAVPASGRLVILDAAYAHPLAGLVGDGARGFAPFEPRENMLIAYNQMPDQAAALPATSYGFYAMALAEILREPGTDLGAMFERIRLRTHDLSQGAQTPWNVNALAQPVILHPGAVAANEAPWAAKRGRALRDLPGDEAYARVIEIDTIPAYEEFLAAHPRHVQARRVRAMIATRREAYYWQRARRVNTDRAYWSYLRRYPRGAHAEEAQARLTRLSMPIVPPPQFDEIVYDDLAPPDAEEMAIYEEVVVVERWDRLPPPSGYAVHFLPPPPVEIIELPPPPPPNPQTRTLPPVAIGAAIVGAGAIGAAIWANREWRRPRDIRPVVVPPARPLRPSVMPPGTVIPPPPRPNFRPPTALPGRTPLIGQPGIVMPPTTQPITPPGVRPGTPGPAVMPPGAGTPPITPPGVRPGTPGPAVMPPGVGTPTTTQPGVRPGTPGPAVMPPGAGTQPITQPGIPPGAIRPGTQPPGQLPPGTRPGSIGRPPGAPIGVPPPQVNSPQPRPPGVAPPTAPQAPRPIGVPPPQVNSPQPRPPGVAPPTAPQAPRPIGVPPPQVRPVPVPAPPPGYRPVPRPGPGELPPGYRPVPRPPGAAPMPVQPRPVPQVVPQPRPMPVAPPPQVRQPAPPPVVQPRPVAPPPPPMVRPVPPPPPAPAARPPAPGPIGQCTPELRARGACR